MKIYANLKANLTRKSTKEYFETLNKNAENTTHEILVFPSSSSLQEKTYKNLKQGVQNFYPVENGSYTGEIALEQIHEFKIQDILIGHSERRMLLFENYDLIIKKFNFAKENDLNICFCIGESLAIRQKGEIKLKDFLNSQLDGIDLDYKKLSIAYEPVWAIGTGIVADENDIKQVLSFLKQKTNAPLLYGGSVNKSNIKSISKIKHCSGVLIGSASWKVEKFLDLIKEVS